MAQRRMGTSPEGFTHGSEDRLDELTVASQIRAREAEIAREYAAESMSPTPSTRESTNPDIITPSGARNARGQLFTTEARKSPSAPIAAKPQQGHAANINDMFTWDHGQLMEHFMAREAGDTVMLNCQTFQLDGPALRVYIADSTGQPKAVSSDSGNSGRKKRALRKRKRPITPRTQGTGGGAQGNWFDWYI